jgi:WD40 repeat protein
MAEDGDWFATGDYSGAIARWDLTANMPQITTLGRHSHYVRDVLVDRVTGTIYSGGDDGLIARWDEGTPHELARLECACNALALDPTADGLFSGHQNGEIWRWTTRADAQGTLVGRQVPGPVTALAVTPGSVLVSTAWDGVLYAWEDSGGAYSPRVLGRADAPLSAGLAPEGERVIAGTRSGQVLSFAVSRTSQAPIVLGAHDRGVSAIRAESGMVVTGGRDGFLVRWDFNDGDAADVRDMELLSLDVALDGAAVFLGGRDGIYRWAPVDPAQRPLAPQRIWDTPVMGIAVTAPDEIVSYSDDGEIQVRDLTYPERMPLVLRVRDSRPHSIWAMVAIPGARAILTAMADGRLLRWPLDTKDGPQLIGTAKAAALAVAPDGSWAVSAGDDFSVMRWDLRQPGEATWLGKSLARIRALVVDGNGDRVVGGDDHGRILSWDASGADHWFREIGRHGHAADERPQRSKVRSIAIAADGSWLASVADDGMIECWNIDGGTLTSLRPVALPVTVAALGDRLLVADRRGGITLFDLVKSVPAFHVPEPPLLPGQLPAATSQPYVDHPQQPEVTLIIDQHWCNEIRKHRRLDLGELRADLCGDRIAMALAPCPQLPALVKFREYLQTTGWKVPAVQPGPEASRDLVIQLARDSAAKGDVLLVSGNPDIPALVAALPDHDRIAIIDDVTRWLQ